MMTVRDIVFNYYSAFLKIDGEFASDLNEKLTMSEMNDLMKRVIVKMSCYTREDGKVIRELITVSSEEAKEIQQY